MTTIPTSHANHPFLPFAPYDEAVAVAAAKTKSPQGVELVCAADFPAQPVQWLWHQRIPIGKVTLLAGDPGLGKSLLALDIAARVTRGLPFADSAKSVEQGALSHSTANSVPPVPCSVLVLSASDDFADTIRPRLDAAGADPARIFSLPSITDLRHDFKELQSAVDQIPDCRLIIVDPVNAFVGPGDSHYHTVVRRVLMPLTRLAAEKRIAILAVTQFRKNDGATIHRAAGSTGFVATARSLWTVCRDPRDANRNLFLPLKQNLTHAARGLAYRIVEEPDLRAPHVQWEPDTSVPTTEEAFQRPRPPKPPAPERSAARAWLQQILAAGPRPAQRILEEGEQFGFLERTLQRAFQELGGSTAKRGLLAGWWWSLEKEIPAATVGKAAESAISGPGTPTKTPDVFEGVTYDEDIVNHSVVDAILNDDLEHYRHLPAANESIETLERVAPDPNSPTGDPFLDQLRETFRAPPPSQLPIGGGAGSAHCEKANPAPNSHPQPAATDATTTPPHKSHPPENKAQSPAPPTPDHPTRAPGSSADSSCNHPESFPEPP